jgi:putative transposase
LGENRAIVNVTFSCWRRQPLLIPSARRLFEQALEVARRRYGLFVFGYVVMPEHVHCWSANQKSR